jgi:phage terminase small subunit
MAKKTEKPIDYSKPLKNAKHERFCQRYMIDLNATASYKECYPSVGQNTAEVNGCKLLSNTKPAGRIAYLKSLVQKKTDITVQSVIEMIADTHKRAKDAGDELNAELKAAELLGKHTGAFEKDNVQRAFVLEIS